MVAERAKRRNVGFFPKYKQAKQVGKRVSCDIKGHIQANFCDEKGRPFSEEWHDEKGLPFSEEWHENRRKIEEAVSLYRKILGNRELFEKLSQKYGKSEENRRYFGVRLHMRVASILERMGKWVNTTEGIGPVAGVKVGDEFHWRGELRIVGLHRELEKGIHYVKSITGTILAVSIVDSGRYENVRGISSDTLIYCGQGENPDLGGVKRPKDQKLVAGNLALKNSMNYKKPVRVIRRRFNNNVRDSAFVYDGLYLVTEYWKEKGIHGTDVYKFLLKRVEGRQASS